MTILHTISVGPSSKLLESCLSVARENDALLFIEDGVYYSSELASESSIPKHLLLFTLEEDLVARGLQHSILNEFETINYRKFVELCILHEKVINWF
jgi:sulfur relay protein TusB/DsrH